MKPLWKYLVPLIFFCALIAVIYLLSTWLQSGLTPLQKILLLGSVVVGVSTSVQGYQAMKALTDQLFTGRYRGDNQTPRSINEEDGVPEQYDRLRRKLILLPDMTFRDALRGFLTVEEQQLLRGGVSLVDRGSALGTISELRKLELFEEYLTREYRGYFE